MGASAISRALSARTIARLLTIGRDQLSKAETVTPKQNSSGGKPKLGRISKMGNRNLRKLLVVSAHAVLFHRKPHTDPLRMWRRS
jgi:transposase